MVTRSLTFAFVIVMSILIYLGMPGEDEGVFQFVDSSEPFLGIEIEIDDAVKCEILEAVFSRHARQCPEIALVPNSETHRAGQIFYEAKEAAVKFEIPFFFESSSPDFHEGTIRISPDWEYHEGSIWVEVAHVGFDNAPIHGYSVMHDMFEWVVTEIAYSWSYSISGCFEDE